VLLRSDVDVEASMFWESLYRIWILLICDARVLRSCLVKQAIEISHLRDGVREEDAAKRRVFFAMLFACIAELTE
jgi:hypothetical protein